MKVALVGERWVEESDSGSNAAFVRQTLLQNKAAKAHFIPMKTHHAQIEQAQSRVEANYQTIPRPYSMVVLGMGLDGHTVSWFPKAQGLSQELD